ncbi:chloride channel protein [Ochrobactrum teleogrylli]|uniref:chloride channel protein n=1 Tax=Ochrobactrum teleogrylli TaxID=2479765 RepID=UPI00384B6C64
MPVHWMWWPALGAVAVGIGGLIDPHVLGAGYASIRQLLDGSMTMKAIALLLVVKAAVWLIALGSGTSGGVLAPLLLLGGALGGLIGQFLSGGAGFWAMIGMAGILSGAMLAPLTSAIFAVELTGHFAALPETIAASASAYAVSVLILNRSILTEKIARRGRHILQEYSVAPFAFLQAAHVMTPAPECLSGKQSIDETIAFFTKDARHRAYPVLSDDGRLLSLISRSEVLQWQVSGAPVAASLAETLSDASQPTAFTSTPLGEVADLMVMSGIPRIPILVPQSHKVVGLVSRQDLLKARIQHSNIEMVRTR